MTIHQPHVPSTPVDVHEQGPAEPARRPPLSRLAFWSAVTALPVGPLGLVLSLCALPATSRRRTPPLRGRWLAVSALVVSALVTLCGAWLALTVTVQALFLAATSDPTARTPVRSGGTGWSSESRPLIADDVPTTCRHAPGQAFAEVDWSVVSLDAMGARTQVTAYVEDASGHVLGTSAVNVPDMADVAGANQTGVAQVRVDPHAAVDHCSLAVALYAR